MSPRLFFEYSTWFFILCLLVGIGYALLLYYKTRTPWGLTTNRILFFLRFALVSLLAGLLVGPFLRLTNNTFEKPLIVLALDDSESMVLSADSARIPGYADQLAQLQLQLENEGFDVRTRTLVQASLEEQVQFSHINTDLYGLLQSVANDFEGYNLSGVVLMTDGIYNAGISPTFKNYSFPVHTVGVGDTTQRQDLVLQTVLYNKISYQGNTFPVVAEVINQGLVGTSTSVAIYKGNQLLESKDVRFTRNNELVTVEFLVDAEDVGIQRYSIVMDPVDGEFTRSNNRGQAFVDVVDGRERILIAAQSPHPDIKAFAGAIAQNDNYEVETFIQGVHDFPDSLQELDLIIFHQYPDIRNVLGEELNKLLDTDVPRLFVVGKKTNLDKLNQEIAPVQVVRTRNESDMVGTTLNENFTLFQLSDELKELSTRFPPVRAPFGPIQLDATSHVAFFQRVGSIVTNRPMVLLKSESPKVGVFFSDGTWRWRLFNYAQRSETAQVDEFILKTVQFLTTRDDKRKFRVSPDKQQYFEKEAIILRAEAYNALYEPIFNIKVDLVVTDERGSRQTYSYVTSSTNNTFTIRNLPTGVYRYTATANVNDELLTSAGEFVVTQTNLEATNLTADHHLLRQLSASSGGIFYAVSEIDRIGSDLIVNKPPDRIYTSEQFLPLINLQWAFFLLLLLISAEWFMRKYQGSY